MDHSTIFINLFVCRKFETKPDSELFVLDTEGDNKAVVLEEKPLSTKQRKRLELAVTPKCFDILLPSSKVNKACVKL